MHLILKCILWILFCWCSFVTDINLMLQSKSQYRKLMTESRGLESFTVLSSEIQSCAKMLIISLSVICTSTVNHHNSTQHLRTLLKNGNFWHDNRNHKCPPSPQSTRGWNCRWAGKGWVCSGISWTRASPGVSKQVIRTKLNQWLINQHWASWRNLGHTQRQARKLILGPCLGFKAKFLSFKRTQSRAVTGLLTGHNTLRRHLYLLRLIVRCEGGVEYKRKPRPTFSVNVRPWPHSDIRIWAPFFWNQRILKV